MRHKKDLGYIITLQACFVVDKFSSRQCANSPMRYEGSNAAASEAFSASCVSYASRAWLEAASVSRKVISRYDLTQSWLEREGPGTTEAVLLRTRQHEVLDRLLVPSKGTFTGSESASPASSLS